MKLHNVLILHKKSTYQLQAIEHKEPRFIKLIEERHDSVTRVKVAHSEHMETLERVQSQLSQRGVNYTTLARADLDDDLMVDDVDLIITVGGDGTFLDASHHVTDVPLLGVNSSRSSSFGHFCLANERTIESVLNDIESDVIQPKRLLRLELSINGRILPELVLNEVLVAHSHPAATSRYFITVGEQREEQRSSGIWIGTPGGSTGSLRSAGAPVLKITETRFEFVVREACMRPGENWSLLQGVLDGDQSIEVTSQMRTGSLCVDGPHIEHHFGLGDRLSVKPSKTFLLSYIDENVNDIFL